MLLAMALVLGPEALGKRRDTPTDPLLQWDKGPVRYLMGRSETKLYRSLHTTGERQEFIRRFWARRDPDPRTSTNEARLIFWRRVIEANQKFRDTPKPGWLTDRGKIYILLGPPFEINTRQDFDIGEPTVAARGLQRWHYRGLQRAANRAEFIIPFYRDSDGDWRMSSDPRLASIALDLTENSLDGVLGSSLSQLMDKVRWQGGDLNTAMDLGALQEIPTEQDLLRGVVEAEQFVGSCQGELAVHALGELDAAGRERYAITLGIRADGLNPAWDGSAAGLATRFVATAQLRSAGGAGPVAVDLGEFSFSAEPNPDRADPWLRFQALVGLPSGRLGLTAAVLDRLAGNACSAESVIEVAKADPAAPRIAGPVLAARRIDTAPLPGEAQPFRLGPALVMPLLGRGPSVRDPFSIGLIVASAPDRDEPVALSWEVVRVSADGTLQSVGAGGPLPDGRGPRAWDFPAGALAAGKYRLTLRAQGSQTELIRALDFEIAP